MAERLIPVGYKENYSGSVNSWLLQEIAQWCCPWKYLKLAWTACQETLSNLYLALLRPGNSPHDLQMSLLTWTIQWFQVSLTLFNSPSDCYKRHLRHTGLGCQPSFSTKTFENLFIRGANEEYNYQIVHEKYLEIRYIFCQPTPTCDNLKCP